MKNYKCYFLLLLSFFNFFCTSNKNTEEADSGVINYSVTYKEADGTNSLINYLPNKASMFFTANKTLVQIKGYMNLFEFKQISIKDRQESYSILRIMDKFYLHKTDKNNTAYGYPKNKIKIDNKWGRANVCGYDCNKAEVVIGNKKYPILYSRDIKVSEPNARTPFADIDGVLLDFSMEFIKVNMHFKANEIKLGQVDSNLFSIPPKYKLVNTFQLDSILCCFNDN